MKKVVTFGELLLRLSPPGNMRFVQADSLEVDYGGAEANVAVSLANYGLKTKFVTKLPEHEIGQSALNSLRYYGVDTSAIVRGGDRVGIYYLEKGASQRPSKVIYDRAYSSIAEASPSDFDWDSIFADAGWFHFTGITAALSDNAAKICLEACKKAKEKNITISFDMNYRKNLWSIDKASSVVTGLAPYIDVCIANELDAVNLFGIKEDETEFTDDKQCLLNKESIIKKFAEQYGFKLVASTCRESISANDNRWSAKLYEGGNFYYSKKYDMHIVDRVGGGDSFDAGLIYAIMKDYSLQDTVEFAVAASCMKHTIEGDYNLVSVEEVKTLVEGDGSGRVQR